MHYKFWLGERHWVFQIIYITYQYENGLNFKKALNDDKPTTSWTYILGSPSQPIHWSQDAIMPIVVCVYYKLCDRMTQAYQFLNLLEADILGSPSQPIHWSQTLAAR